MAVKIFSFRWSSPDHDQHVIQPHTSANRVSAKYGAVDGGPVKIASYFRVGSNTTLNIILYAATTGEVSLAGGKSTPGSLPKLGSAVQVRADYVRWSQAAKKK